MRTVALICNTEVIHEGKRAGAAALPRSPGGNLPFWLFMRAVAPEVEKGAASEPATPS